MQRAIPRRERVEVGPVPRPVVMIREQARLGGGILGKPPGSGAQHVPGPRLQYSAGEPQRQKAFVNCGISHYATRIPPLSSSWFIVLCCPKATSLTLHVLQAVERGLLGLRDESSHHSASHKGSQSSKLLLYHMIFIENCKKCEKRLQILWLMKKCESSFVTLE